MKKLLVFLLLIFMAANASAALTNGVGDVVYPTDLWWSGDRIKDQGLLWMQEVEGDLEGWTLDGGTTLTFPTNGGTISNATNGDITLSEASEDIGFRFSTNNVELVSSTGVLGLDINDLYLIFNEISAPTGNPASNLGWLYVKDDAATTKLYFKDSAGTVTDILASASGNTLNAAYDQGGAGVGRTITADTGAVTITNTDADTAFLLAINAVPGSSAALGGLEVTVGSNSTENAIEIENTGSGDDIQGTGDAWAVDKAGVGTFSSIVTSLLTSTGTVSIGDGTSTVAVNSSVWDVTTAGAVSGITTIGMSGDLTISAGDVILANGKAVKGSVTNAETVGMSAYDVDGSSYVATFLLTNGNTIAAALGTGVETVAIDSTTWDVSTAGVFSGLTGLTTAGGTVNVNVSSNFATNINTGSSTGAITLGGGSGTFAVASTGVDISTAGAFTNVTDITLTGDITGANGKAIRGSAISAETYALQVYDNDTGPGYKNALLMTNGNTPAVVLGNTDGTTAVSSSDWAISTTGAMTGIGAITADGLVTASLGATITGATTSINVSSNFAVNINTGTSTGATSIGNALNNITLAGHIQGTNALLFDGSTADNGNETTIAITDPTGDNTMTVGDDTGSFTYTPTGKTTKDATDAALPITHAIVEGTSDADSAWSLANGENGQILTVVIVTDGGSCIITPATSTGWATAVLDDDGDTLSVLYIDDTVGWVVLGMIGIGGQPVITQ